MTDTGGDQHHWLFEDFALGTLELYLDCFGVVWSATSSISAEPTVAGFICLYTSAVPVLEVNSFQ